MNNLFKTNNRFSALAEDFSNNLDNRKKDRDYKKLDKNNYNYNNKNLIKDEKKPIIKEPNLSLNNFPALISKENLVKSENIKNSMNFLEKIKLNSDLDIKEVVDKEYEKLKPGCVLIKKDLNSNKIIHLYKNSNKSCLDKNMFNDIILNNNIINTLVDLHDKRKNEFIELWGYDDWEKNFQFPNYDYDYFEKLDELFEDDLLEEVDYNDDDFY